MSTYSSHSIVTTLHSTIAVPDLCTSPSVVVFYCKIALIMEAPLPFTLLIHCRYIEVYRATADDFLAVAAGQIFLICKNILFIYSDYLIVSFPISHLRPPSNDREYFLSALHNSDGPMATKMNLHYCLSSLFVFHYEMGFMHHFHSLFFSLLPPFSIPLEASFPISTIYPLFVSF